MKTIYVSELGEEHLGTLIQYDGDGPTLYGGQRPHPSGDAERVVITLDGRESEGWLIDEIWIS